MEKPFTGRYTSDLEVLEDRVLAPYGCRSAGAGRRFRLSDAGRTLAYRTAFQRDRDRILHALAFRRLKHKTQVYVPYEGDHHRTRLTHTLEVAQVGRTIARALGLNEDLVEAIALAHDLGQPPFGAAGEQMLAALLAGQESAGGIDRKVLAASGGFRPNYQSLRVVDRLEQRYEHPGLNLTDPVREGIWKCGGLNSEIDYPDWDEEGLAADQRPTLEAQVVTVADRLARLAHDLEDGMRAGEVSLEAVERLKLGAALRRKLGHRYQHTTSRYRRQNTLVRSMIHLLVSDVLVQTSGLLQQWLGERASVAEGEGTPPLPRFAAGTVAFSDNVGELVDELESFVETQVYRSFAVSRLDARARTFINGLFTAYYADPLQLDDYVLLRYRSMRGGAYLRDLAAGEVAEEVGRRYHDQPGFIRLIADHIGGMSDTFALKEYERLYLPEH
ncbi:MAG: dGTP triphosphohydrolase [Acidobacteriota bacterium]